jgi:RNA polymerase sigma factor (sigma-70 family)
VSDLLAALAKLSAKQRSAVILHHYSGWPIKDVAGILGSTPGAVKVHLLWGRTKLRELLGGDDA